MKTVHFVLIVALSSLLACNKDESVPKAPTPPPTPFNQLYANVVATSPNQNEVFIDLEVHEYFFEVSAIETLSKIGYQSLPSFSTTPYLIELYDSTSGTLLYSGSHLFSWFATSYVAISPITLLPGHSYTIKRIQTNWAGNIGNTIGRIVHCNGGGLGFPLTYGTLTITGSSFYGTGGPMNNWGIPFIDMVFQ